MSISESLSGIASRVVRVFKSAKKPITFAFESIVVLPLYFLGIPWLASRAWWRLHRLRRVSAESHPVLGERLLLENILGSLDPDGRDFAACRCVCKLWREVAADLSKARPWPRKAPAAGSGLKKTTPLLRRRMRALALMWVVFAATAWMVRTENQVVTLLLVGAAPLSVWPLASLVPPAIAQREGYVALARELSLPFSVAMALTTITLMVTRGILFRRFGELEVLSLVIHIAYAGCLLQPRMRVRKHGHWFLWRIAVLSAFLALAAPVIARVFWSSLNVAWTAGVASVGAGLLWGSIVAMFFPDGVAVSNRYGSFHPDNHRLGGITLGLITIAFARECCLTAGGPYASGSVYFAAIYLVCAIFRN